MQARELGMERLILIERLNEQTLEISWKFPTGSEDEDLLLKRVEFLWREITPLKARYFRHSSVWQTCEFGDGFALVAESLLEPNDNIKRFLIENTRQQEKGRALETLARNFLIFNAENPSFFELEEKPRVNFQNNSKLIEFLKSITVEEEAAWLWQSCANGQRVCIFNGDAGELLLIGKLLSARSQSAFVPLIIGPTEAESNDLKRLSAFICCFPSEEVPSRLFYDVLFDFSNKKVSRRPLISSTKENDMLVINSLLQSRDDQEFLDLVQRLQLKVNVV